MDLSSLAVRFSPASHARRPCMSHGIRFSALLGVLIAAAVCAACTAGVSRGALNTIERSTVPSPTAAVAPMLGTRWLLEDLSGRGVLDRLQSTLELIEPGRVSGRAGCNLFTGTVSWRGDALAVSGLALTRQACSPAVDDQESRYMQALGRASRVRIEGPFLFIDTQDGPAQLKYTQMP